MEGMVAHAVDIDISSIFRYSIPLDPGRPTPNFERQAVAIKRLVFTATRTLTTRLYMRILLVFCLLSGCTITIEPWGTEHAETPATQPATEPATAPSTTPVADEQTESLRKLVEGFDKMVGITDTGDDLSMALDDGYVFTTTCRDQTLELTFDAGALGNRWKCGGASGGFRNDKPIDLMFHANRGPKDVIFPYEVCGERHATVRIVANRMSASVRCRAGAGLQVEDAEWDRFSFP